MVFSHRFRDRVSSRTQQTSDPAATAAAVKTMMRCVVVCGLLLGGLQFSTAPSISFSVAVTPSGESETAQSSATESSEDKSTRKVTFADPIQTVFEYASVTSFEEPLIEESLIQQCFHPFINQKSKEYALEDLRGIEAPLPRWKWLNKEIMYGRIMIVLSNHYYPDALCDPTGLVVALIAKFYKQFDSRKIIFDEPQKDMISRLIKAAVDFTCKEGIKKKKLREKEWKEHDRIHLFRQCGDVLARYFINAALKEEDKINFCKEIPNVFHEKAFQ